LRHLLNIHERDRDVRVSPGAGRLVVPAVLILALVLGACAEVDISTDTTSNRATDTTLAEGGGVTDPNDVIDLPNLIDVTTEEPSESFQEFVDELLSGAMEEGETTSFELDGISFRPGAENHLSATAGNVLDECVAIHTPYDQSWG
jgi:hypothetical protein